MVEVRHSHLDALGAALAWLRAEPDLGVAVIAAEHAGHEPLAAAASVPFVRTEVLRPAALQAWRDRAEHTREVLDGGAPIDVLLLGAGPTNAALCVALQRARPDLAIVVVDDGQPGGAFARAGAGFRLNTWSAPGPPGMSLLAEVDLHAGLAVSPAVMSAARFPTGDTLADAALLSWLTSSCGVVADTVTRIELAPHEVAFALRGADTYARAPAAVLATGFGTELLCSFDVAGAAFVAAEVARPVEARRAVDAEAWFAHVAAAGPSVLDGASLGVVGAGPSAMGVLALACGLGPAELVDAPGRFSRWRARPTLTWVTGTHGYGSAREAQRAWETAGGEERARPGGMGYVLAEGTATLLHELVFLEDIGRLVVVPGRVDTLAAAGDGVRLVIGDRAVTVGRAVLCTGYASRVAALIAGAREARSVAELVAAGRAGVIDADGEPIAIAIGNGRAHIVGAAIEDVVTPDESRPPFAESAMRASAVAARLARALPSGTRVDAAWRRDAVELRGGGGSARVPLPRGGHTTARPWDRLLVPVDAMLAVVPWRLAAGPRTIELRFAAIGDDLELRCDAVDDAAAARIARRLSPRLAACVARHHALVVAIDVAPDGHIVPASAREVR